MIAYIGWIGAILSTLCVSPQAWDCYKDGHARGMNWLFLLAWTFGKVFTIIYLWDRGEVILLTNYFMNLIFLSVIIKYKIWERKLSIGTD